MAISKRLASPSLLGGVHKKTPMKRSKKKTTLLKKVVDYLKSDDYLFAPLLSSQPFNFSPNNTSISSATPSGIETKKPFEEDKKNFFRKVGEYLKSDCYMYAPLIVPPPSFSDATEVVSHPYRGRVSGPKKTATGIAIERVAEKTKQPAQERGNTSREDQNSDGYPPAMTVVKRTVVQREMVKHMVHQNYRTSSVSGKGLLGKQQRKLNGSSVR